MQKSISKLIFAGYTGSKNPVRNRLKIQFVDLDFSKLIFSEIKYRSTGSLMPIKKHKLQNEFHASSSRSLFVKKNHTLEKGKKL
jgi:hypothetical protein